MSVDSPIVQVAQGTLRGIESAQSRRFLNIPYADTTQRWKPPAVPPPKWDGVRDATEFGNICHQPHRLIFDGVPPFEPETQPMSEDCLNLNVYTPPPHRIAVSNLLLPVMVWIHGGSFSIGSNSTPGYRADQVVADYDVVIVTVNYRLGIFGFYASDNLREEAKANKTGYGNYGLLDQAAAIEWVAANISAFGGDPSRITIFGESAGGMSVHYLCLYAPHLPIKRAIMQSGTGFGLPPGTVSGFAHFHTHLKTVTGARTSSDLRAVPGDKLQKILDEYQASAGPGKGLSWKPTLDADVPNGLVKHRGPSGTWNPNVEAVIIGDTDDEGLYFAHALLGSTGYTPARLESIYPPIIAPFLKSHYGPMYADGTEESVKRTAALVFSEMFQVGSRMAMDSLENKVKVFAFRFAATCKAAEDRGLGACHAVDMPYTFNHKSTLRPHELPVARALLSNWVHFAATGSPLPSWERYTRDHPRMLLFESGDTPTRMVHRDQGKNFDASGVRLWGRIHSVPGWIGWFAEHLWHIGGAVVLALGVSLFAGLYSTRNSR
ncbi:alpha/beta-hydrolase [Gonapodya prolifera JEL478]|uniref:Carboxylic ester hydrolase n=1 Tax=Gonapodya prolifera (strain JEL478) TaxID=1344416 RepID=A0A139AW73_GONPJ|nr:alpha/beta-hydrolase [Gonapodya prolifera JEL478]|eukprot:KXS20954.1 alpha/beta-hydrolase [Gonapodya prolifera JEL478]